MQSPIQSAHGRERAWMRRHVSTCDVAAAEAALAPEEAATQVEEGAAAPEHEDGEPLVDEGAEDEDHDDAPAIPKQ